MTIEFHCPECGKLLKTADNKAGVRAKCPGCSASIMVPDAGGSGGTETGGGENYEFGTGDDSYGAQDPHGSPYGTAGQYNTGYAAPPPPQQPASGYPQQQPYGGSQYGGAPYGGSQYGASPGYGAPQQPGSAYGQVGGYGGYYKPHRGGMILAFAILGWAVCVIFGIVAWVMANSDLREMRAGTMDPSGEGMTNAARIIAMIQCILAIIFIPLWLLMVCAAAAGG